MSELRTITESDDLKRRFPDDLEFTKLIYTINTSSPLVISLDNQFNIRVISIDIDFLTY